jgi:predicted dehydrogenase
MLKILLVGLGSIGRRHLNCLKQIGSFDLAALRTLKGTKMDESGIKEFYSMTDALNFKPDGVIVSNPTSLHAETALPFLRNGTKVLIEKPVAYNTAESELLKPYADLIRVAYCMRFHPLNDTIKLILKEELPFKVGFRRSYYLPKWHPYADYRTEYTARKELGGGVVRTLSHEIDLMIHWFGQPLNVTGVTDKVSELEIDTDDYAFFTCKYLNGCRVNFELDFFSPTNVNIGELYTTNGQYHWDMAGIWFTPYMETNPSLVKAFDLDELDKMYMNQMKDFVDYISSNKSINATFEEGIDVLQLIEQVDE